MNNIKIVFVRKSLKSVFIDTNLGYIRLKYIEDNIFGDVCKSDIKRFSMLSNGQKKSIIEVLAELPHFGRNLYDFKSGKRMSYTEYLEVRNV